MSVDRFIKFSRGGETKHEKITLHEIVTSNKWGCFQTKIRLVPRIFIPYHVSKVRVVKILYEQLGAFDSSAVSFADHCYDVMTIKTTATYFIFPK